MAARSRFVRRLLAALLPLLALLAFLPGVSAAEWPSEPMGGVPVTSLSTFNSPAAAVADGEGGVYVAFRVYYGTATWIHVQRLDESGSVQAGWSSTGTVVRSGTGLNDQIVMVADADGVIVSWVDYRAAGTNGNIYAMKVLANGTLATGWTASGVPVSTRTVNESALQMISDGAGGAFLTWVYEGAVNLEDVYAAHITAAGALPWSLALAYGVNRQYAPHIAPNGSGGFVLFYSDDAATPGSADVKIASYDASSVSVWGPRTVSNQAGVQLAEGVLADGDGGHYAMWLDSRAAPTQLYATHLEADGGPTTGWTNGSGEPVATGSGAQSTPQMVLDGAGGVFFVWQDARGASLDIYCQRRLIAGIVPAGWGTTGLPVCTVVNTQEQPLLVPDGSGGAVIAWEDHRPSTVYGDIYAQRITASGSMPSRWTSGGVPITIEPTYQDSLCVVSDGAGGAIIVWREHWTPDGYFVSRAQHVDTFGALGDAGPTSLVVSDLPGDQGGKVVLRWGASYLDAAPGYEVTDYWIWRQVPGALARQAVADGARLYDGETADGEAPAATSGPGQRLFRLATVDGVEYAWEWVGTQYASAFPQYSYVAATTTDSVAGWNPATVYMVQARHSTGRAWWDSDPDSGYSVDNLAPAAPAPFTGVYSGGSTTLAWGANREADLAQYLLHRGSTAGFVPGPGNLVTQTTSTGYVDASGQPYYYKLAAADVHGNVSPYALVLPAGSVDVPGPELPREVFLLPPTPTPVRSVASFRMGLPQAGPVSLVVFDVGGRRVHALTERVMPAGEHVLTWDLRDEQGRVVADGLYFARLSAGGRVIGARVVKVR